MKFDDTSGQKKTHLWIMLALAAATIATAAVLWLMVGSLEGTSKKLHQYFAKSKEPESNMEPIFNSLPKVPAKQDKPIEAAQINKPPAVLMFEQGLAQVKKKDVAEGAATFGAAMELARKLPSDQKVTVEGMNVSGKEFLSMLYSSRADCFINLQQWQKAVDDYSKALELNPDEPTLYVDRATAYTHLGKDRQAMQDFKSMSQHDSSMPLP